LDFSNMSEADAIPEWIMLVALAIALWAILTQVFGDE
jgi:hypothetical protein